MASAIRFVQLQHLFDLAKERPSAVLSTIVLEEPEHFLTSLKRVLYGPHLRWTKKPSGGSVGTFLDTYPENRLQSLVEWAEGRRSGRLLGLKKILAGYLLSNWGTKLSLDINPAVRALEAIDAAPWVQANGGTELRQRIIEAILADLNLARYYEWDIVLEYYEKTQPWADDHEGALDAAIREYKENGVDEEAKDCSSTSELEELRDGLTALQKERGLTLEDSIYRVVSRLNDQEETVSDHSSYTSRSFPECRKPSAPANDEEIRNLFRTLID